MPGPGHGEPWSCATARARATLSSAGTTVLPSTITIITVAMLNGMDNDFVTLDAQITSRTTTGTRASRASASRSTRPR